MYQIRELIVSHLPPERWLSTPLIPQSSSQHSDRNTCVSAKYVVVKWAVSDVEKGGMGFFLAANISLKYSETYSLGGCIGPGLEQILSRTSTLNFVPQGLYAG